MGVKGKGWYAGDEVGRKNTVYQWRCTPEEKEILLQFAAAQRRTANKLLSEALEEYIVGWCAAHEKPVPEYYSGGEASLS
ncbi:MAG: hypothetical protein IJW76_01170 [Clostridia bacterium]|nr:hypothetical protein [Clostridia bacterium]